MLPPLQTEKESADAAVASSVFDLHPIRDGASTRPIGVSVLFSLGLTPLLIFGLSVSLMSPNSRPDAGTALDQTQRSVSLLLHEPDRPSVEAPVRNLYGLRAPGGNGHQEGTETLDPRLVAYTSRFSQPSDAIDPDDLSTHPKADRVFLSLNPTLPLQAGGDGLAAGTGKDSAKGPGGLFLVGGSYDFRLVPIRQVQARHQLAMGEHRDAKQPVRIQIQVGSDGVPFRAKVVSGPMFLLEEALAAAMQWRFEPLALHGLKAPIASILTFYPDFVEPD